MEDAELTDKVKRSFARYQFEHRVDEFAGLRRGRRVPRSVAIGLTAVAAVTLWVVSATPFVGKPPAAFAGWQAVPSAADVALRDSATSVCLADAALPAMSLVAQDQRGSGAALVYAGAGQLAICLVERDAKGNVETATSGVTRLEGNAGSLKVDTELTSAASGQWPGLRIVAGRFGPNVRAVSISRADGVAVEATAKDGYFVAWWPTEADVAEVTAKDASGQAVASAPGLK